MMTRFTSVFLALSILVFGVPAAPLSAYTPLAAGAPIGMLTYVEGRVDRNSGDDYFPVIREEQVLPGDTIRTKTYSRAEIVFNDKSVLRIGENSQVQIRDYKMNSEGKRENAKLFVDRGKVRVIVSKSATGQTNFSIDTPNAEGAVRGSDICISYLKSSTSVLALEGEIATKSLDFPDKQINVSGGHTAYVPFKAPPFGPRPYMKVEKKRFETETNPAPQTPDQSKVRKAIVAKFKGPVRIRTKGSNQWHLPGVKESLGAGDEIETGEDGKVQIVLESGRIINLRPNTHLKITRLSRDPKTGSLEDILESKLGEIRAKIDKKKSGSRFEIHSPVAIAAVRGTILYLFIRPNATNSFFEQGHGALTSLIRKAAIDIEPGHHGSVDADGKIDGPYVTSPEKLDEIEKDWEIEDDTYGYTPPVGPDYIPNYRDERPEGDGENPSSDRNVFDEIKLSFEGDGPQLIDPLIPITPKEVQAFGVWTGESHESSLYANDNGNHQWSGEDFGEIMAEIFPWTSPQAFIIQNGNFFDIHEGEKPLLFNTIITSEVTEGVQTTTDGGAFFGFTAGIWSGVEGFMTALFIDPDKNVGLFAGIVEGSIDNGSGLWNAGGLLIPIVLGNAPNINAEFFDQFLFRTGASSEFGVKGDFNGDGDIDANLTRSELWFLADIQSESTYPSLDFGIYNFRYGGTGEFFRPAGAEDWYAVAGGRADFGFYRSQQYGLLNDSGYWISEMDGSWTNGEIFAVEQGAFLTYTHLGIMAGGVTGLYEEGSEGGTFILQSVGAYQSAPLSFAGQMGSGGDVFASFDGESFSTFGSMQDSFENPTILGGIGNIFENPDIYLMGAYNTNEVTDSVIFASRVNSYNIIDGTLTTFNGESFFGFSAGRWSSSEVAGNMRVIFILNDDGPEEEIVYTAGVAGGSFNGSYYDFSEGRGLWSAEGELDTLHTDSTSLDPQDLNGESGALEWREFEGAGRTVFNQNLNLDIVEATGATVNLENQPYDNQWGIWGGLFGGTFYYQGEGELNESFRSGFGAVAQDGNEEYYPIYILGTLAGDFTTVPDSDGGNVSAAFNGVWISEQGTSGEEFVTVGKINGDAEGNFEYIEGSFGDWEAAGVGEWTSVTELDPNAIGFRTIQSMLESDFAIGEIMNSVAQGAGAFNGEVGSITGSMDFSMFTSGQIYAPNIWTAFFDGSFTGMPGEVTSWDATFANGDVTATLDGFQWNDGQWLANVTGSANGQALNGQAGGTYTADQNGAGNFSGVGVGTTSGLQIGPGEGGGGCEGPCQ